jgi:NADPH-dependent 2,4-dienoyl-CoA reductase/sulfur reductase-like enzyme
MGKPTPSRGSNRVIETQVVVVGGGPAGLSAGLILDRGHISVLLIDENSELGGQYYRQRGALNNSSIDNFRPKGTHLVESVKKSRISVLTSTYIFAVGDHEKTLYAFDESTNEVVSILYDFVIVSTGSQELVLPYSGWETIKCMTPGMVSRLFDIDLIEPKQSVVLGGSGPFLLSVASHLLKRGVTVKAIVEYHHPYRIKFISLLTFFFPSRLIEYLSYRKILWENNVSIYSGYQIARAEPQSSGIKSVFQPLNQKSQLSFTSDFLAISYGFSPTIELAALLDIDLNQSNHSRSPEVRLSGKTSKDWVYVAGESAGIQGWRSAKIRGEVAALSIIDSLGTLSLKNQILRFGKTISLMYESLFSKIRIHTFQEKEPFRFVPSDSTIVCRCENVTYAEVKKYLNEDWSSASEIKAETRVGMGTCQGKQCGYALNRLCTSPHLEPSNKFTSIRAPIRPLPISALLQLAEDPD